VSESSAAAPLPLEVSAVDAVAMLAAGVRVVDVREQAEWDAAHVPEAVLIPMSQIQARFSEIPLEEPVLVLCHSGARSERVALALRDAGFDAASIAGGILAWHPAGGTVVASGPGAHA
jgi:rhodanese-related sulfurtransferase